jgi:NitT/TauT family transport system permease protein
LVTAFLIAGLNWASLSIRRVIAPLVSFFAKLPLITLAPLAVVWIGFGSLPAVALTFFICVLPLITELQKGFFSVSVEVFDTLEIMGATPAQVLWKVQIPASLPFLLRGLRLALPLALTGVVITEFVGADKGLGYVMLYASSRADPVQLFSALAVLMLMALFGYFVLFIAERLWVPWSDVVSVAKRDPQRM